MTCLPTKPATTGIETLAAVFGILGALALAVPGVHPAYGFALFLVSTGFWICFSRLHGHRRMLVQQLCFALINLVGLWNWWLGPLVLG